MTPNRVAALLLAGSFAACDLSAASKQVLPWLEDYSKAIAQARAKDVPIFVEAWAPW